MSRISAVTPGAGTSVLIGILGADDKVVCKIWPVLNFVTVEIKSVAGDEIQTTPIVLDDSGKALEINHAVPELVTTHTAYYRLLSADAMEIPSEEYAAFEQALRERHAKHVAYEAYLADRRRRLAEQNARMQTPEWKEAVEARIEANRLRLAPLAAEIRARDAKRFGLAVVN